LLKYVKKLLFLIPSQFTSDVKNSLLIPQMFHVKHFIVFLLHIFPFFIFSKVQTFL